ncbi:MAG: hypothetical protein ABSG50_12525 [Opitutaceae bacterium]
MNDPGQFPDSVYDRIAVFLPADLRTSFYRYVAHVKTLRPDDDFVVIIQGMGILALLARQIPEALAEERGKLLTEYAQLCRKHEAATARATDDVRTMFSAYQKLLEQNIGTWQSREQQTLRSLEKASDDFEKSVTKHLSLLRGTVTDIDAATKEHRIAAQRAQNLLQSVDWNRLLWPCVACGIFGVLVGLVGGLIFRR